MGYLEKAALAGVATGMRSTVAVGALISAGAPGLPTALRAPVAAGAVLARGAKQAVLPAVILASAAALVSARVCHDLRVAAAKRFDPSAVASIEDAAALSLASASARA